MLYERPPIYALTHIGFGFVAVWYPIIGILALLYQLAQYTFDFRFFLFELKVRSGNSLEHTLKKVFEMFLGYVLGLAVKRTKKLPW